MQLIFLAQQKIFTRNIPLRDSLMRVSDVFHLSSNHLSSHLLSSILFIDFDSIHIYHQSGLFLFIIIDAIHSPHHHHNGFCLFHRTMKNLRNDEFYVL